MFFPSYPFPINRGALSSFPHSRFTMPYKQRRRCPLCESVMLNLSDHLSRTHGLNCEERQPFLQMASQELRGEPLRKESLRREREEPRTQHPLYPEFAFQHPFSMLVVGPTQSGKTDFVEQMFTDPQFDFPTDQEVRITWFYNQWQPRYDITQWELGSQIEYKHGLPDWSESLQELDPEIQHILVFDDLMNQAVNSPILSRLFTQGRHRNASVILLMQNMFPKGKYNTDISRNAQYLVLFRSPSDRKQINTIADRIFAENRFKFMQIYSKATSVPYGYVLIDNHPRTDPENQVVTDVFGTCQRHPLEEQTSEENVKRRKVY